MARLGVADRPAGVGHEHVVEAGPGHAHRADGHVQLGEQPRHELLPRFDREGDQPLVHGGLQSEPFTQFGDRRRVVRGADLHPVLADAGLERLGRVDRDDLAVVDDRDPAAVLGLVHVVRGEEDGDVLALLQLVDVAPDRRAGLRVQAHGRLVEEQHMRGVQQAPGDLQTALHAAGVGADQAFAPVPQAHHLQHLTYPRRDRRLRHAVQVGVEAQVLLGREVAVQRGVLEHQPDVAPHRVPLGGHVVPGHDGPPRRRPDQRAQDADRGGLARAIRAEETERLAARDLEVDAPDGLDLAVSLGQLADRDRGAVGAPRARRCRLGGATGLRAGLYSHCRASLCGILPPEPTAAARTQRGCGPRLRGAGRSRGVPAGGGSLLGAGGLVLVRGEDPVQRPAGVGQHLGCLLDLRGRAGLADL